MQQTESQKQRRFTVAQYITATVVLLLGITAISYAATTLTIFTTGPISSSEVNANFAKLEQSIKDNQVPAGTLVAFSGTVVPAGYIKCPTNSIAAIVSRTAYPTLYAAIGVTWGAGDGRTTFVMPWFPEGYALLQANANVSTQTVGEVMAHTHAITSYIDNATAGVNPRSTSNTSINGTSTSGLTGGPANMAAGTKVIMLVKT